MNTDKIEDYKYGDLTEKILGCAFEVHNSLGCGFLEKVYHKALIHEFDNFGLEFKTVEFLTKTHIAQVINYLRSARYTVGLILNFNQPRLEYKRIVT